MRKQGIWVTRFVFLILFVFVMAFMGYHIYDALTESVGTVSAVLYTTEKTVALDGLFVRDEILIPRPQGIFEVEARNGQRMAKGDTLAHTYRDVDTQRQSAGIMELSDRIDQMKLISRHAADITDTSALDGLISDSLLALIETCDGETMAGADMNGMTYKSLLYKRAYTYESATDVNDIIAQLTEQMNTERSQLGGALSGVEAPQSGTFSEETDGFESLLSLQKLDELTPRDFQELTKNEPPHEQNASLGKLALGFAWRYAALLPDAGAKALSVGSRVDLRVDKSSGRTLPVSVVRVAPGQDGQSLVVLEGNEDMGYFSALRRAPVDIIEETHTGLRIPREALRMDKQNNPGVYCLVNNQVQFKAVSLIVERDNYYLAAYTPENTDSLLPTDEVIVRGKNLYDGRIIQ